MENPSGAPEVASSAPQPSHKSKLTLSLDFRIICIVLLVVIIGMLAMWRPWSSAQSSSRTISVTGDTTVKAEPDEYQFSPSWEFKNADKQAAIDAAAAKQKELTTELKKLGVKDSQIKSTVSGYQDYGYSLTPTDSIKRPSADGYVYTLSMTITQPNLASAEKVQDYLATTAPQGSVTPYPTFSEAKRKQLESKARDAATRDARSKADQSARNLGFKVAGVKSVDDGSGLGGGIFPMYRGGVMGVAEDSKASTTDLTVQPGENELSYSVTVVYFIR